MASGTPLASNTYDPKPTLYYHQSSYITDQLGCGQAAPSVEVRIWFRCNLERKEGDSTWNNVTVYLQSRLLAVWPDLAKFHQFGTTLINFGHFKERI